jgi:LCP family protein required for cell wall assembly
MPDDLDLSDPGAADRAVRGGTRGPRSRESRPRRPRSRRTVVGVRALFASLSLLIVLVGGVSWATFQDFKASVPHGDAVPADPTDPDGGDQNILLVGNDTRSGATPSELKALHAGHDTTTDNADTMMVLHIPSNGSRPTLVSFPRDSWVTIPGHGKAKLNAAYPDAYNSAKQAHKNEQQAQSAGLISVVRTIHALTGLHIDHYMQVSLLGFYRISEAIGGVTVCLNAAQNKTTETGDGAHGNSGINLPKGLSTIKGTQALAFVRQRHGLPHGDLDRIKRQQYFLKAAFTKIESAGTLLNPFKIRDLLKAVGSSLLTDPGLDLISLARQFESLSSGKIAFETVPNNGPQLITPDGVPTAIVAIDTSAIPAFVAHLEGKSADTYSKVAAAAPTTVTVDVLNGANVPRLAGRNADQLKKSGFKIANVDSTTTTARTTVEYRPGSEAQAKALAQRVPHAKVLDTPDVARVTLVLGTDGRGVTGIPGTATPTRASGTHPAKVKDPTHGLGCID